MYECCFTCSYVQCQFEKRRMLIYTILNVSKEMYDVYRGVYQAIVPCKLYGSIFVMTCPNIPSAVDIGSISSLEEVYEVFRKECDYDD